MADETYECIFRMIRELHSSNPKLRFQQIMTIAAYKAGWSIYDLFYCPDEIIVRGLYLLTEGKSDDN